MIKTWVRCLTTEVKYHQPNAHGRNLVMSVLNSTVTKREAKDYLNKYTDGNKLNYCIVFLRHLSECSDTVISGFSKTISRIQTLGLRPLLVLDPSCQDITYHSRRLDNNLHQQSLKSIIVSDPITVGNAGSFEVNLPMLSPHIIPIIEPYQYNESEASRKLASDPSEFMSSLVKNISINIDKVFLISKFGGLPSIERHTNSHVFVNLSQEYEDLRRNYLSQSNRLTSSQKGDGGKDLVESLQLYMNKDKILNDNDQLKCHMEDLEIMNKTLSNLPHTSTGLITTFTAGCKLTDNNPLVYNVLTDRSLISSSLPRFKRSTAGQSKSWYELPPSDQEEEVTSTNDSVLVTTVFKKGIDIHVFDYRTLDDQNCIGLPSSHSANTIESEQTSNKLNLHKVNEIINSSFKKSLDLSHYLDRINGNIASIIVVGDYEGISILTYEGPEDHQFVYLDKFAVTQKLKGSLGISDIIFNLMFRKFPDELIWRSREDNVVNKWYFQRSTGVLHLSLDLGQDDQKDSIFKLFYYGNPENESFHNVDRLRDYAKYVRDIVPSWKK
ncbi:unnamed protein product [Kluyveromyces dobzhanskii CBS 2104]|uniref:Amino-acid acetyltransferase, mitochondrial n=1 Tax=Kluyveromyces dobzhanskii CBS 2104 TaxID=1427455 RepID=A0A0A8L5V0_9SACH|nr:unnamed protein product [Kluyveromyces dobzhanskii CBS 2104]